jgi:hypothetical protein
MKNRKPEMSENDGRNILAHRLADANKMRLGTLAAGFA